MTFDLCNDVSVFLIIETSLKALLSFKQSVSLSLFSLFKEMRTSTRMNSKTCRCKRTLMISWRLLLSRPFESTYRNNTVTLCKAHIATTMPVQ